MCLIYFILENMCKGCSQRVSMFKSIHITFKKMKTRVKLTHILFIKVKYDLYNLTFSFTKAKRIREQLTLI
jgi:hypothetical protein